MRELGVIIFAAIVFIGIFATPVYAAEGPGLNPDDNVIETNIGSEDTRLQVLIDYSLLNPFHEGDFVFATYGYAHERQIVQIDVRIRREGGQFLTEINNDLWLPF